MSAPTLQVIEALRAEHELLAPLTSSLSDAQLATRSCAAEWTLAQVLSHLGSGAQIMLAALRGGLGQAEPPAADANQQVWARWDALSPREQAEQFRTYDEELVAAFEALDDGQRESGSFTVGTLPFPFSTAGFAGLRLNEVALHSWDVRAALDTGAELLPGTAGTLVGVFAGELGFMLGFIGKADQVEQPVVLAVDDELALVIEDSVSLVAQAQSSAGPTARFTGDHATLARLLGGRLGPAFTPAELTVTGNVGLDDLRRVFPGF